MGRIRVLSAGALTCSCRAGYRPERMARPVRSTREMTAACGPRPENRPAAWPPPAGWRRGLESGAPGARRAPREERAGAACGTAWCCGPTSIGRRRPGPYPALLQRTPYSKNDRDAARRFSAIAARGYVVVVQDTRGRYTSDGVAVPHDEADDGYDSVQWAAPLPGVNGQGRDVRRQLSRHHPARGRDPAAAGARRAVSRLVLQPPPRHGVPGRRVLSERRAGVESRSGDGRPPARPDARRRSRRPDRPRLRRRARCFDRPGCGTCRSSRSTSSTSIASRRATGRCCRIPTPTRSGRLADIESAATISSWCRRFTSPAGTTRCSPARCATSPACARTRPPRRRAATSAS